MHMFIVLGTGTFSKLYRKTLIYIWNVHLYLKINIQKLDLSVFTCITEIIILMGADGYPSDYTITEHAQIQRRQQRLRNNT